MLFLPFEQRMTRDVKSWNEKRQARRSSAASYSGKSTRAGHIHTGGVIPQLSSR